MGPAKTSENVETVEKLPWQCQYLSRFSLIVITCGSGGLQLLWSTIFAHGSSYLFALGFSTTQSSIIWAITPICGSIIPPIVGAMSDRSQSPWGRRKPFIVAGALVTIFALFVLAWIERISASISALYDSDELKEERRTRVMAVISLVILNIAIQPLQFGLRSLTVDACSSKQQSTVSAWSGRFAGLGNVVGYFLGSLPHPQSSFGHEATWRFRYMTSCTAAALFFTTFICCYFSTETNPPARAHIEEETCYTKWILKDIERAISVMSPRVRRVCIVQFVSWMGWFAFLFYSTTFVSQCYISEHEASSQRADATLKDDGMKVGTTANLLFAIVALVTITLVPKVATTLTPDFITTSKYEGIEIHPVIKVQIILGLGQVIFAICSLATVIVSTSAEGTFIVAIMGFSWGITQWAPFAMIGEEIAGANNPLEFTREEDDKTWNADYSGTIIGLHNAVISIPQILGALASGTAFAVAEKVEANTAIPLVLTFSAVPAAIAACLAFQMQSFCLSHLHPRM